MSDTSALPLIAASIGSDDDENHKSGNLKKAEFFYTGILKSDPNHPHANHNMGLIAFSTGKEEKSLTLFQTALKVNPSIEQFCMRHQPATATGHAPDRHAGNSQNHPSHVSHVHLVIRTG